MARIIREESENALDAVAGRLQKFDALPKNVKAEFIEAKEIYKSLKQIRDISAGAAARQAVNNRLPLTSYIMGGGFATSGFLAADSLLTGGLQAQLLRLPVRHWPENIYGITGSCCWPGQWDGSQTTARH